MVRLPFALAILGLLFARTAIGASPSEASVSKPSLVCPQAKFGNEDLQAQYEKVWKQFTAEVDLATKALDSEIATRFTEAQKAGHLDLALMWDGMKKQFNQLSELRWDSAKEKKTWKQRFGEADFPDELTALLKKCDQDYKSARERLEEGYKNIESALTKTGNLEQALKVRAELKAVLAGDPVPPTVPQATPQTVNKNSLKERLAGNWIRTKTPDIVVFANDGSGQLINTTTGRNWGNGQLRFPSEEVAEIKWSNGYVWQMRLAGDDFLAICESDPAGQVAGDGIVLIRDVKGGRNVVHQPSKVEWIVGHWSDGNSPITYIYEKDGSCRTIIKQDGSTRTTGKWEKAADGSVLQADDKGWKATVRPTGDKTIELLWTTPAGIADHREQLLRLK